MTGRTKSKALIKSMTARELLDSQAYLTVPMLVKIWNLGKSATISRLTDPKGPFFGHAFKLGGEWQIETTVYEKIIRDLKIQKPEPQTRRKAS